MKTLRVHTYPDGDLILHTLTGHTCPCNPTVRRIEPGTAPPGRWVELREIITHHSLHGRTARS